MFEDEILSEIFAIEETEDSWYRKRIKDVQEFPRKFHGWKVSEGKLYYYKPNSVVDPINPDLDAWKLVLLLNKREELLAEIHSDPQASHLGIEKSYARVLVQYYWPGMYRDISLWIRGCEIC